MLEGLWGINPNLIKNIAYYVSIMPLSLRKELLDHTRINTPKNSYFNYLTWKNINFDENYNVMTTDIDIIDWSKYPVFAPTFQNSGWGKDVLRETNRYYFLLFFFSAFKRNPERGTREAVEEWIVRCLVDVLVKNPYITPYYPFIKGWKGSKNLWELPYKTEVDLSQIEELGIYKRDNGRIITIRELSNNRGEEDVVLGLNSTVNCGLYDLFISECFDLKNVNVTNIYSQYIQVRYIDERAYYDNGEDLKQDGLKEYGLTDMKLGRSFDSFKAYWTSYSYLIPIGFLSKRSDSFRFLNYSIESFENLK